MTAVIESCLSFGFFEIAFSDAWGFMQLASHVEQFIWRMFQDYLTRFSSLSSKYVDVNSLCPSFAISFSIAQPFSKLSINFQISKTTATANKNTSKQPPLSSLLPVSISTFEFREHSNWHKLQIGSGKGIKFLGKKKTPINYICLIYDFSRSLLSWTDFINGLWVIPTSDFWLDEWFGSFILYWQQ
jgi:hypothetical protein